MNNPALETIRKVGITGLCHTDGCPCLDFTVHHVHVEISCHKSGFGPEIRVYSHSLDHYPDKSQLVEVMEDVKRQFTDVFGRSLEGYRFPLSDRERATAGKEAQ